MELKHENIQELRKSVETLLNATPDNKKIQLPKQTLELLLFDTYICNKEKNIKIKLPVWSGDFLTKLDLSQVDFEDVSWNIFKLISDGKQGIKDEYSELFDTEFYQKIRDLQIDLNSNNYCVHYGNTNARIDFSKCFELKNVTYKKTKKPGVALEIGNCDFRNVDLSNNDFSFLKRLFLISCNLNNTNITFNNFRNIKNINAIDTDFSNNNLSNLVINAFDVIFLEKFLDGCKFINSKFQFIFDFAEFSVMLEYSKDRKKLTDLFHHYVYELWNGCYLNDEEIKLSDGNKSKIQEEFKNVLISSITNADDKRRNKR